MKIMLFDYRLRCPQPITIQRNKNGTTETTPKILNLIQVYSAVLAISVLEEEIKTFYSDMNQHTPE